MKLILASITLRAGTGPAQMLFAEYFARLGAYASAEHHSYRTEQAFLTGVQKQRGRTAPWVVLLEPRGLALSSEALADRLQAQQDAGRQAAIFAIGPADGWSKTARALAQSQQQDRFLLSFGPLTLPHELARIVLVEQLYRACTILARHPYHSGH